MLGRRLEMSARHADGSRLLVELAIAPGAVNVVDAADLSRDRGAYLEDLLRAQPGVVVQSSQGAEDTHLSIRGSGVQSDDLRGVSVLVDGIPLNQADGDSSDGW